MKKFLDLLFNHERYQSISVILICIALIFFFSCEPECNSILEPEKKITQTELEAEIAIVKTRTEKAHLSLEQQQELLNFLFENAILVSQTGTFTPMPFLTGIAAIFGIGATVDNVRKRKEIKTLKNGS